MIMTDNTTIVGDSMLLDYSSSPSTVAYSLQQVVRMEMGKLGDRKGLYLLSLGIFIGMKFQHNTPYDDFPVLYRDDIEKVVNAISLLYDVLITMESSGPVSIGKVFVFTEKKKKEIVLETMDIIEFIELNPDERVALRFGEDIYFSMIQDCCFETKQFLLDGNIDDILVPFTLRLSEIFGSGNVQASLETLLYIMKNPNHAPLMRDRSRCAIFMLEFFFFS